ncbi:hypothetical protein DAPPUDRAFT_119856 [Daphnia pulex]|uniref:Uncharacterized protein n=1 Tax=Daphnia pulex TaxID=6669 RepID=E9HZN9_DAPPU|nr:hypothetical protein DAPPUDRAFT_119856 [Daphnia pulex]|eukprot:EFX62791.1 hypothetical protein DAPPUDRAFT_119856 [Daphnia pulex]
MFTLGDIGGKQKPSRLTPVSPTAPEALELADQLLRRCAAVHNLGFLMLEADNQEIFDMVLCYTAYHYPENIVLPQGYTPPNLAISTLYWKAWLMLLMLIAHNPGSLGSEAWNSFPTLGALMEMCITNDFATSSGTTDQTELQLRSLNATLRLGHLLCRSHQPDFLLLRNRSHGWLIWSSPMKVLGTFCLFNVCEFLLHEACDDLPVNDLMNDSKQQLGKLLILLINPLNYVKSCFFSRLQAGPKKLVFSEDISI